MLITTVLFINCVFCLAKNKTAVVNVYNVTGSFLGNFACMKSLAVLAPCRLLFVITAAA